MFTRKKLGIPIGTVITDEHCLHELFVHRQGYGIVNVNALRGAVMPNITLNEKSYYTSLCDLLMVYITQGFIQL